MVAVRRLGDADPVHAACSRSTARAASDAVVFDVSHLGSVRVHGRRARSPRCSGRSPTTSTASSPGGRSTRTCSTPTTRTSSTTSSCGGSRPTSFLVMPNASNTEPLVDALGEAAASTAGASATIDDVTATRAVLAVQGPEARELLATVAPDARRRSPRFAVEPVDVRRRRRAGSPGTGYTGEDGVELHVPGRRAAPACGSALLDAGITPGRARRPRHAAARSRAAAARPRARARASRRCRPGSAGWCASTRATSAAATPLEAEQERGRRPPAARPRASTGARSRARATRCCATARSVGVVTSGNFSPMLGHGIALAFLPPDVVDGDAVTVDVRGREVPADRHEAAVRPPVASASERAADRQRRRSATGVRRPSHRAVADRDRDDARRARRRVARRARRPRRARGDPRPHAARPARRRSPRPRRSPASASSPTATRCSPRSSGSATPTRSRRR